MKGVEEGEMGEGFSGSVEGGASVLGECENEERSGEVMPIGLTFLLRRLPAKMNEKTLVKILKEKNVSYTKVDKRYGAKFARVKFKTLEDKRLAAEALDGLVVEGGKPWGVSCPERLNGERKRMNSRGLRHKDNESKKAKMEGFSGVCCSESEIEKEKNTEILNKSSPDSSAQSPSCRSNLNRTILHSIAPLSYMPYQDQLELKMEKIRGVLAKLVQKAKQASSDRASPPWLEELLKTASESPVLACPLLEILPSPVVHGYRNKIELTIGQGTSGQIEMGFMLGAFKDGLSYVVPPDDVPNVCPHHILIYQTLWPLIRDSGLEPWQRHVHRGFWRSCLIRSNSENESLVMIQVNQKFIKPEPYERLKEQIRSWALGHPNLNILSLWIQEYDGISNYPSPDAPRILLLGAEYIYERLLSTCFRISPTSFFQVNTSAASVLYQLILEWSNDCLAARRVVLDVCCGTGTIGLCIAKNFRPNSVQLIGLELAEDAVLDARANADINQIQNATFHIGKAEDLIEPILKDLCDRLSASDRASANNAVNNNGAPTTTDGQVQQDDGDHTDVHLSSEGQSTTTAHEFFVGGVEPPDGLMECIAILDPPRGGLHKKTLRAIRQCSAVTKIIYVSCNPNSLIDDALVLTRAPSKSTPNPPFAPKMARPVDLFPHTHHTELVVLFER